MASQKAAKKQFLKRVAKGATNGLTSLALGLEERGYQTNMPRKIINDQWGFVVFGQQDEVGPKTISVVLSLDESPIENDVFWLNIQLIADGVTKGSYDLENNPDAHGTPIRIAYLGDRFEDGTYNQELFKKIFEINPRPDVGRGVLDWLPSYRTEIDRSIAPVLASDAYPPELVEKGTFELEAEFTVPDWFWSGRESPYREDPIEQTVMWEGTRTPRRPQDTGEWLAEYHAALMAAGWPRHGTEATYSYFEDPLEDPETGEQKDPSIPDLMRFYVRIDGEWLVKNPLFLSNLEAFPEIKVGNEPTPSRLSYYRIAAINGPLQGGTWESSSFSVMSPLLKARI